MPASVWARATVLGVGGILLAVGCTSNPEDGPAPTPSASRSGKPVPTRELVVWADQVCTNIDLLEKAQEESATEAKEILTPTSVNPQPPDIAADTYLSFTGSQVEEVSKGLEAIDRSGIGSADKFVARWGKQVDGAARSVERLTDFFEVGGLEPAQKIERAEQVAKVIAEIPLPESEFVAMVEKDPRLAVAHHLAPRCVPATPGTGPEATPTRSISAVLPEAKDGTNVDACADGSCEILVNKTVDVTAGSFELQLSFRDSKVTVSHAPPEGSTGEIQLAAVGSTGSFGLPDGAKLTIEAIGINQKGAVLKLTAT